LNDSEEIKPDEEVDKDEKPFVDEETSYSFLFLLHLGHSFSLLYGDFGMMSLVVVDLNNIKILILKPSMLEQK